MRIAVVGNPGSWSTEKLADAFEERAGQRYVVNMSAVSLDLETGKLWHFEEDLSSFDALAIKKIAPVYSPDMLDRLTLLELLQRSGSRIFSKPTSIQAALNRASCTVRLRAGGIPMPPTTITEDPEAALRAVRSYGRAVLKPLFTSKARGMELIEAGPECRERLSRFKEKGNQVLYVQKMLESPGMDLGVTFLGGTYLATYARRSGGGWSTTTSRGGKYASHEPSREIVELAYRAQSLFGLDFTCVDVMETRDGPMVFEVSAFGGFRGLLEACSLDAAALFADHVLHRCENEPR